MKLEPPQASLGSCEAAISAKDPVVEALTAPEDLVLIFGEEGSKGITRVLRDFTFYQGEPGAKNGRFLKLHTQFVPHYNGLGFAEMKRLREPVKITVTKVVKSLHMAQRSSHRPLTFEAIRATLAQLVYLEPRPERNVVLHRVVKINEGKPLPGFLAETQWMIKLVESDVPESVLDSEVTPPVSRKWKKGSARKMYFGDQARGWNEARTDLVDLAVLTFPRLSVPRFKLSRLLLQVDVSRKVGISAKRRADVILEYRTHSYGLRDGTTIDISPEARKRDCAYAYGLFLS